MEPVDKSLSIPLPALLDCNHIPTVLTEIPIPDVAYHNAHLKSIADKLPTRSGCQDTPIAGQRYLSGALVIVDVSLGGAHIPLEVRS